jgi:hypothetical protein
MTLIDDLTRVANELREHARRLVGDPDATRSRALTELWRPELPPAPAPLRRLLEPAIATAALTAIGALAGVGLVALVVMLAAGALIYLIITYVFGIELGLDLPGRPQ